MASKGLYRLFVANVPWTISGNELKQYFSQFGHVADATVIFNRKTGLSRQYGFVEVTGKSCLETILLKKTHKLEGKVLTIKQVDN